MAPIATITASTMTEPAAAQTSTTSTSTTTAGAGPVIQLGHTGQVVFVAVAIGVFALLWYGVTLYDRVSTNRWRNIKYDAFLNELLKAAKPNPSGPLSVDEVAAFVRAASQPPRGAPGLTRTLLALSLLTLVGVALVALLVGNSGAASDLLKTVVTALTAALATVLGFYFGAKTASEAGTSAQVQRPTPVPAKKPTVPDAPTGLSAVSGPRAGEVTVSFTAPADDGGSPITGYTATSSPGGINGTGTGSPISVSGLSTGAVYTFSVHATNAGGDSAESSQSSPATAP
jgi:hypothetical protein